MFYLASSFRIGKLGERMSYNTNSNTHIRAGRRKKSTSKVKSRSWSSKNHSTSATCGTFIQHRISWKRQKHGSIYLEYHKPQLCFRNIFDWICYFLLLVSISTHVIDVSYHTNFVARLHIRIMAVTVILLWIRLLKNARAFTFIGPPSCKIKTQEYGAPVSSILNVCIILGPFIVMLTLMTSDFVKFALIYIEFFIPFSKTFTTYLEFQTLR